MEVRDATPDDAESIAELNTAAWRVAFRGIVSDDFLAAHDGAPLGRREALENLEENAIQLVAEHEDGVVGWLAAQPCEDDDCDPERTFEVRACYVTPSFWRRGIGRLLMNALSERLASSRWNEVKLWTAQGTPDSHAFYRSLGFEEDGRVKDHQLSDGSSVTVIRFSHVLAKETNADQ